MRLQHTPSTLKDKQCAQDPLSTRATRTAGHRASKLLLKLTQRVLREVMVLIQQGVLQLQYQQVSASSDEKCASSLEISRAVARCLDMTWLGIIARDEDAISARNGGPRFFLLLSSHRTGFCTQSRT